MLGLDIPPGAGDGLRQALADAEVHAAVRGNALRIGPHLHNTPDEVDRLLAALREGLG
jgi:selenocysteine lyase/cysteine desulfurase